MKTCDNVVSYLPDMWNKDKFHLVNIKLFNSKHTNVGSIWADDDFANINVFEDVKIEGVFKFTGDHANREDTIDIGGNQYVPSMVECDIFEKTLGFVFIRHICQFIIPRCAVRYSTDTNDNTFYKKRRPIIKKRGFVDTIYCNPGIEDFNRVETWNPCGQNHTIFSGGTFLGYYLAETHGDYTKMYKIEGDNVFEELGGDDLNITTV